MHSVDSKKLAQHCRSIRSSLLWCSARRILSHALQITKLDATFQAALASRQGDGAPGTAETSEQDPRSPDSFGIAGRATGSRESLIAQTRRDFQEGYRAMVILLWRDFSLRAKLSE